MTSNHFREKNDHHVKLLYHSSRKIAQRDGWKNLEYGSTVKSFMLFFDQFTPIRMKEARKTTIKTSTDKRRKCLTPRYSTEQCFYVVCMYTNDEEICDDLIFSDFFKGLQEWIIHFSTKIYYVTKFIMHVKEALSSGHLFSGKPAPLFVFCTINMAMGYE